MHIYVNVACVEMRFFVQQGINIDQRSKKKMSRNEKKAASRVNVPCLIFLWGGGGGLFNYKPVQVCFNVQRSRLNQKISKKFHLRTKNCQKYTINQATRSFPYASR